MKLQCRVVGDDGIVGQVGCDQVGIDLDLIRLDARRHGSVEAAADADEAPRRDVLREEVLTGKAAPAPRGVGADERLPAEYRVRGEEVD